MQPGSKETAPEAPRGRPPRALLIGLMTLGGVLLLSLMWEFGLETMILGALTGGATPEPTEERWEFVATSVAFAALAMTPPLLWLTLAVRRERSAERALDDTRQQFQTVVEAVSEVIWEVDTEGRYTYVSENVKEALGVSLSVIKTFGTVEPIFYRRIWLILV